MIMHLLKSIRLLEFIEKSSQDTLWFQRQILKKKYQDKKQDQSYINRAKMYPLSRQNSFSQER